MNPGSVAGAQAPATGVPGVWEMMLGLVAVVCVILALAWLARRLQPGLAGGGALLRVIAALPLGPRERLLLVEAGGTQLLIGVTGQQISALHTFEQPIAVPPAPVAGAFAERLREALAGGKAP